MNKCRETPGYTHRGTASKVQAIRSTSKEEPKSDRVYAKFSAAKAKEAADSAGDKHVIYRIGSPFANHDLQEGYTTPPAWTTRGLERALHIQLLNLNFYEELNGIKYKENNGNDGF